MDVLIVHYHLNPGGVTSIIENQVEAISAIDPSINVKVITGNSAGYSTGQFEVVVHDSFNYDHADSSESLHSKVNDIKSFIRRHVSFETVIHGHNLNLGKNPALTFAIYELAAEGIPLVNHCHDFPEDRPKNFQKLTEAALMYGAVPLQKILYTEFPNNHYVVLNSCDYARMLQHGVGKDRIHLLANPVSTQKGFVKNEGKEEIFRTLSIDPVKKLVVYPVRAIERKNIGEFILFAVLFSETASFAITQAPKNPAEIPQYEKWKSFCIAHHIPVIFEAGDQVSYPALISSADFCMSTSVREGFGLAFLEPWMAGVPVTGRFLDCIIADLEKAGLVFPKLYKNLFVSINNQLKDFKELTSDEQESVITALLHNKNTRQDLLQQNPILMNWLDDISEETLEHNRQIIKQHFAIKNYGKRLLGIYRSISG